MNKACYLAVDIGASSGRHIAAWLENGLIRTQEVYRFPNGAAKKKGHLCWDMEGLFRHVVAGLKACAEQGFQPVSVGIDTWAVDFVLLTGDDQPLGDMVAYRDSRTEGMDALLEQTLPFAELYRLTGIAKQPFNTVYQMMAVLQEHPNWADRAAGFLMVPEYLAWRLTGVKAHEYTNASSTALLDAAERKWSREVIRAAGLPEKWFDEEPLQPGAVLGPLLPEIAAETGLRGTRVILTATHDTGSAYLAVPARDDQAVFLSSGTWSLLGTELQTPVTTQKALEAGFTNEGGAYGTIRFLKNIMGMWMLQCLHKEIGGAHSFAEMAEMAAASAYPAWVDATDNRFLAPESMTEEVQKALLEQGAPEPASFGDLCRAVTVGLAKCYDAAIRELGDITGRRFTSVNIVGGGSQNLTLNALTARETGLDVIAGPTEGTALGNLAVQMILSGEVSDLQAFRDLLKPSFGIR
ncbi:MAG: rhamnulokinase [Clostridia bacterium]|nr:rhamnulokinase [Clostridia bacterium]